MALSKGKKVLIAIVGAVVTIGAVIGTVFAVKKIKENVEMTDRPGITTPVNPGQGDEGQKPGQGDEGQNPGQDEGQEPGQGDEGQQGGGDEGQKPGEGDEGQDPGQGDEEHPGGGDEGQEPGEGDEGQQGGGDEGSGDETPGISEEEYYEKNLDLIKAALVEEYSKDNPKRTLILDEDSIVINEALGEIYFAGHTQGGLGAVKNLFFTAKFDNNILSHSQEKIYEILNSKTYDINFTNIKSIRGNLSTEVYNEFSNYLLKQKYDFNGKGLSFSKEAIVLNISEFKDGDAFGGQYIQFLVIDGNMIYTARLENAMPASMGDIAISQIMGYSNNVFKITAVNDFAEFGVDGAEQGGGEAENAGYVLDLSEVPISKAEAASLAFDIWSLNPEKDMDVILPANDSGLEM